jgi:1,2-diacylglycerol 3-alpha-glucosyltransferase
VNVLMMTNTYLPHRGGVARSVGSFTDALRGRGHRVLVVAPTFENAPAEEKDVLRTPALQKFNGSDFSVRLPVPGLLFAALERMEPDVVHSHHPFLLGDTALRIAALRNRPLVFTHHTMYERYTHYVPGDSPALKRFAIQLATEYANLCDHVVAPSQSVAEVLKSRGVSTPISCIPTGIDPGRFSRGDGAFARRRYGIPQSAFVVGHIGRLAPEKNLGFLARAVAAFVRTDSRAHFLVVGSGPAEEEVRSVFAEAGLDHRLHLVGPLDAEDLANAYHALDVFAFASQSETQGMVLAEAMTAGVPVIAVVAPGVREVVHDGQNGRLLDGDAETAFAEALAALAALDRGAYRALTDQARATAADFSLDRCTGRLLDLYGQLLRGSVRPRAAENAWTQTVRLIAKEWELWSTRVAAAVEAMGTGPEVIP